MKKTMMMLMITTLLFGVNAYAANGDLVVGGNASITGNLGVGTSTPTKKLDVVGNANITGTLTVKGITFGNVKYANLGEDTYTGDTQAYAVDNCNGDGNNKYTCTTTEARTCTDAYLGAADAWMYRTATCLVNAYLTIR